MVGDRMLCVSVVEFVLVSPVGTLIKKILGRVKVVNQWIVMLNWINKAKHYRCAEWSEGSINVSYG